MALNTYLTFDGNCREAFEFYRSVFGGEFASFQTFGEGPPDMPVSDAEKSRVMHVSLPIGSSVLMGSDSSSFGPPVVARQVTRGDRPSATLAGGHRGAERGRAAAPCT